MKLPAWACTHSECHFGVFDFHLRGQGLGGHPDIVDQLVGFNFLQRSPSQLTLWYVDAETWSGTVQ